MVRDRHRPVMGPRRGRRGRRLGRALLAGLAVAALVGLAVGIATQVEHQSVPYQATVDRGFAALVGPLGTQSATTGRQVWDTLVGASSEGRTALLADLSEEVGALSQAAARAAAATPPVPATPGAAGCQRALAERAEAVTGVRRAVLLVLGGPTGTATTARSAPAAAAALSAAGGAVRGADRGWAGCRAALRRAPGHARLPASTWAGPGGAWAGGALGAVVGSYPSVPSLAAAPALAIEAVTTQPSALAVTGPGVYALPATDEVGVQVVVDNTGDVTLPGVVVAVQVTAGATGAGRSVRTVTVSLAAGASTAVRVGATAVTPGGALAIDVTATAGGGVAAVPLALSAQVAQAASSTAVVASADPVGVGSTVRYTATVAGSLPAAGRVSGVVAFADAGLPVPGCTALVLSDAVATCTVRYDTAGLHSITATYDGTASILGSTSPAITETVRGAGPAPSSAAGAVVGGRRSSVAPPG